MAQKSLKISLSEAENSASEQGSGNEKKQRKWTFGLEAVVDKFYDCQNSGRSKCSYNLNQGGANNSASTAKNSDLYAKKVLMLDHQPNDSDTSWMNMAIERAEDDENHT